MATDTPHSHEGIIFTLYRAAPMQQNMDECDKKIGTKANGIQY